MSDIMLKLREDEANSNTETLTFDKLLFMGQTLRLV